MRNGMLNNLFGHDYESGLYDSRHNQLAKALYRNDLAAFDLSEGSNGTSMGEILEDEKDGDELDAEKYQDENNEEGNDQADIEAEEYGEEGEEDYEEEGGGDNGNGNED